MGWTRSLALAVTAAAVFGSAGEASGRDRDHPLVRLRERAWVTPSTEPRHRASLRLEIPLEEVALAESVEVSIGSLHAAFTLVKGRFRGRVVSDQGTVRVRARHGEGVLRAAIRARSRGFHDGGVFGGTALRSTFDTELRIRYRTGTLYGLEPGEVVVNGVAFPFAIAVAGRKDELPRPPFILDPWDQNDLHQVVLVGSGIAPGAGSAEPIVQFVPSLPGERWRGRLRGHGLGVGEAPVLSMSVDGGDDSAIVPIDEEALEIDGRVPEGTGIRELVVGGTRFVQSRFDAVVQSAYGAHRARVTAATSAGGSDVESRNFSVPASATPLGLDADVQVLEIREDGSVWAWGENFFGEVGDGSKAIPASPVPLSGPRNARSVAAGDLFSLAVDGEGSVWQWGYWEVEREVKPDVWVSRSIGTLTPSLVPGIRDIVKVAAGEDHGLALDENGRVWAWGANEEGQLGDGTRQGRLRSTIRVKGLPRITDVAAGWATSMALDAEGGVWVWGSHAPSGDGTPALPAPMPGLPAIQAIDARGMCLALAVDGTVWAWGNNQDGQLGDGTTTDRTVPVQVAGLEGAIAVDAGSFHAVALLADGTVWAWGLNISGELGNGNAVSQPRPVRVLGLEGIRAVAAGTFVSLALDGNGALWAWGSYSHLEPGPVGWRSDRRGVYPTLALRDFKSGHVKFLVRPAEPSGPVLEGAHRDR